MSDNTLRFVATNPEVLPEEAKTAAAQQAVAARFPAATVDVQRYDHVALIDNGANLESVRCASCGADLLDDGRWTRLMDIAWTSGMIQRRFDMACCGTSQTLEELDYDWPLGFGRLSIDARNPNVDWYHPGRDLGGEEQNLLQELALILGVEMRAFWQHI